MTGDGNVKFFIYTRRWVTISINTFNYTVKEVVPTTAEAGMSYDQMEAKVAVTVTKTGHTLTTATTYSSVNGIDANGNPTSFTV